MINMTKESSMAKLSKKEEKKRNHQNNKQISLDTVKIKEKYGDLIENTDIAIATIDKKGRLIYVNDGICSLSGYSKNELLGRPFVDFLHPDDKKKMIKLFLSTLFKLKEKIHFEFRIIHKNSTIITCCTSPTIFRSEGKIKGFHAIIQDITRYKKTEEQIKNSKERYENLIELAPDSIVTMDLKGYITSCNSAATRIFRYSKDDLVGKHFSKIGFLHVKDIPKYLKIFVSILRGKGTGVYELTVNDKDGTVRIVETNIGLIKENNKISGILAITRDITERKQAESALKESEEKWRSLVSILPDYVSLLDKEGRFLFLNHYAEGFTEKDVIGSSAYQYLSTESKEIFEKKIAECQNTGKIQKFEHTAMGNYGIMKEYEDYLIPILKKNKVTSTMVVSRDITERKKAEEMLRESQKRFQALTETTNDFVWEMDANGVYTYCSPQIYELWGYKPEDMIGRTPFDFMIPEDREHAIKMFRTMSKSPNSFKGLESSNWDKTGRIVMLETSGVPFFDIDGRLCGYRGISRDITDRKRVEEEIKKERDFSKNIVETAQAIVMVLDTEGKIDSINPFMEELSGYKLDEVKGKDWFTTFLPECDYDRIRHLFKKSLRGIQTRGNINPILTKDGREILIEWFDKTLKDKDGKIIGLLAIGQDVTERNKTQEIIKSERDKLESVTKNIGVGLAVISKEYNTLWANEVLKNLFGDVEGKTCYSTYNKRQAICPKCGVREIFEKGVEKITHEQVGKNADGNIIWSEIIATPLKDNNGNVISALEVVIPITQRKQAEEALKKSEERYKRLFNSSPDLLIETDEKGNFLAMNQKMAKSLGAPVEKLIGKNIFDILPREIAEERATIARKAFEEMKNQETYDERAGRHFHNTYVPILHPDGSKTIQTVVKDITEKKKTEDALRESEEKYRTLLETTDTGFCILDLQGNILDANSEYVRLSGHSSFKEIQGRNVIEWTAKYDLHRNAEELKKCMQQGFVRNLEIEYVDKNGEVTPIEINATVIQTSKDNKILTLCRDITERKKAEDALRRANIYNRCLIETSLDPLVTIGLDGKITDVNIATENATGYPRIDLIGKDFSDFFTEPEKARTGYQQVFREGEVHDYPLEMMHRNGHITSVLYNASVYRDEKNEVIGVFAAARDITERKKAEELIKDRMKELQAFFSLSELTERKGMTLNKLYQELANILPTSWKHTKIACARIVIVDREFQTKNFTEPKWMQSTPVKVNKTEVGRIDVGYLEEMPEQDEGPFLKEERLLINALAERLGHIIERMQAEEALKQSEEKYRILFNDVPIGISITDKSGHIVDCNQYLAEIFRYNLEELKAINIKSLYMNPKDRERLLNLLNKKGRVVDWECSLKRKDGAAFCAILNVDVIDREGQKLNLTSLQDITERKVAEEKIKSQNVQLKKLDRVKNDFLNTTSHELRTPVASIKGYIQMLLKQILGDITEEQKKALEVLLRNTNRLDHLIQDILDISRLESGTMKLINEKTDIIKMVKEVAETMQASAGLKRIKINIDIQKEIPDLMIDQERIKQVLTNLVDNAIKFSPDDSYINISTKMKKDNVLFEVQDFGRGIPKSKQNKIFERFYQVDSGIDRKFGGIGLGLTISKKIIDTYGGEIWVDSIVDKGSSFKFSLPVQSAKNIEDNSQEIYTESP